MSLPKTNLVVRASAIAARRSRGIGGASPDLMATMIALMLAMPVLIGLAGTILPAFGYLPALGGESFGSEPFVELFQQPGLFRSCLLGVWTGLASTFLATAGVALFLAAFYGTRTQRLARTLLGPLLAVPHAAAAFGLAFLIAPSGLVFRLLAGPFDVDRPPDLLIIGDPYGLAMIAGLTVKELPFLLLVAFAALPQADPTRRLQLTRSLGYGRAMGFLLAVWPSVYRQIRLPVLAVAAFASSVVDVAIILGPSTPAPLAVRLVAWMGDPDLQLRFMASAGALLQLALTGFVLLFWIGSEKVFARFARLAATIGMRGKRDRLPRLLAGVGVAISAASILLGLAELGIWSFAGFWGFPDLLPTSFAATTWVRATDSLSGPLWTTFAVATASAAIALVLVILLLESRRRAFPAAKAGGVRLTSTIAALLYLPLIVPQVAFLFGLKVLALTSGFLPSLGLLVTVHLVFVMPYVALALADPWYALDPRFERVATGLGRSPWATLLHVRLPMLALPILTALAIGFAVSVGQYLPTLLMGEGRLPTITTEAVALGSGGNRRVIGVYALLQTALPCLAFAFATLLPRLLARGRVGLFER